MKKVSSCQAAILVENWVVKHRFSLRVSLRKPINLLIEHCIDLKDDFPVLSPPRKIPYSLEKPIKPEIKTMFENNFIEKSNSQYASPIAPILNKNGHCVKSVQIRSFFWFIFSCIRTEYSKMRTRKYSVFGHFSRSGKNKNSCRLSFVKQENHFQNISNNREDLFIKVKDAKVFSVLDLQNRYFHIPVKHNDHHKTASFYHGKISVEKVTLKVTRCTIYIYRSNGFYDLTSVAV